MGLDVALDLPPPLLCADSSICENARNVPPCRARCGWLAGLPGCLAALPDLDGPVRMPALPAYEAKTMPSPPSDPLPPSVSIVGVLASGAILVELQTMIWISALVLDL